VFAATKCMHLFIHFVIHLKGRVVYRQLERDRNGRPALSNITTSAE